MPPRSTVRIARGMRDERASDALTRIEQALARIEAAAEAMADSRVALIKLRSRHETLRERVEGVIGEIDRMLDMPETA